MMNLDNDELWVMNDKLKKRKLKKQLMQNALAVFYEKFYCLFKVKSNDELWMMSDEFMFIIKN